MKALRGETQQEDVAPASLMMGVLFVGTTNALGVVWRTKTEGAKKAQRGRISEVLSKLSLLIRVKSLYLQDRKQKILNTKTIVDTQNDGDWDEIEN